MKLGRRNCYLNQARSHSLRRSRPLCYVCQRSIRQHPVYIRRETYRHKRCKPGSRRYERLKGFSYKVGAQ